MKFTFIAWVMSVLYIICVFTVDDFSGTDKFHCSVTILLFFICGFLEKICNLMERKK